MAEDTPLRFPDRPRNRQGRPPKDYPGEIVRQVSEMYASGMSQAQIGEALGTNQQMVHKVMRKHQIPVREKGTPRGQAGKANFCWKGDQAKYAALHLRVAARRGKPQYCSACDSTIEQSYEWANLTGLYDQVWDYIRLCRSCHRRYDVYRRQILGVSTSPLQGGDAQ